MPNPHPHPPLRVLTAPEVAEATGYDVSTVCRWARSGHLPTVRKLPGKLGPWLFEPDVLNLVSSKRPPAEPVNPHSAGVPS